jgi:hypothetical protein
MVMDNPNAVDLPPRSADPLVTATGLVGRPSLPRKTFAADTAAPGSLLNT